MKTHLFRILKQETSLSDKNIWHVMKKYYDENNIDYVTDVVNKNDLLHDVRQQRELLMRFVEFGCTPAYWDECKDIETKQVDIFLKAHE